MNDKIDDKIYLRAQGKASGTKDWIAIAYNSGLSIHYGRTGTCLRNSFIPKDKCRNNSPMFEFWEKVKQKKRRGYIPVFEVIPNYCIITDPDEDDAKDTVPFKSKAVLIIDSYAPEKENAFY